MRIPLKAVLTVLAAASLFTAAPVVTEANAGAPEGKGLRESLVESSGVERLYSIDGTHSYVEGSAIEAPGAEVVREVAPGKAVIIRHGAEPLVYKSPSLPPVEELDGPEAGGVDLSGSGLSGADLYQKAYLQCEALSGEVEFVIPVRRGGFKRLTRVDAVSAFTHIVESGGRDTTWYIACDGDERFVVEKGYRSLHGGRDVATVTFKRGLEGVNYVEGSGRPLPQARTAPAESSAKPVEARGEVLEEIAKEAAFMRSTVVKVQDGSKYSATYLRTRDEECDNVSVRHEQRLVDRNLPLVKVYTLKLCDNGVKILGVREPSAGDIERTYAGVKRR